VIAIIGEKGEKIDDLLKTSDAPKESTPEPAVVKEESEESSAALVDASDVNASVINMPKMSDTMTEGVIANWLKKVGDDVKSGDILAEVETDKATMELEAYEDGKLLYISVEAGSSVPVDGVIAIIGEEGADYKKLLAAQKSSASKSEDKAADAPAEKPEPKTETPKPSSNGTGATTNGRIKASPLAKKMAEEKGFDIAQISGTGEGGRIVKRDVESFTPSSVSTAAGTESSAAAPVQLPPVVGEESFEDIQLSQMRKTIAKRLSESKFTAPHFYLTMEINMDKAVEA
jgi:pyruvate dehydrogenase E2 component (dihydrolipoamide acetyltransferase)